MSEQHSKNPDLGAAFFGLIGGALFIGIILYVIVVWTNSHFEAEKAAHKAGAQIVAVQPTIA